MTYTIVVPYGYPDSPTRATARDVVVRHLEAHHPDWPVVLACATTEPWSKGAAVDAAVRNCTSTEGLVIHDADVLVSPEALKSAALAVVAGRAWAMPHSVVYRLSRRGTMRFLHDDLGHDVLDLPHIHLERPPHPAPPGGGCTVLSRKAYDATGGIDPRFVGWGGEDISWARALDTLVGQGYRGTAPMWHLWHEPDVTRQRGGRALRGNERLASRYLDATGDPSAMMAVIAR